MVVATSKQRLNTGTRLIQDRLKKQATKNPQAAGLIKLNPDQYESPGWTRVLAISGLLRLTSEIAVPLTGNDEDFFSA